MEEKKLTDEEIVKALECCERGNAKCSVCPKNTRDNELRTPECRDELRKEAIDLILCLQEEVLRKDCNIARLTGDHNRKKQELKAEIERLTEENAILKGNPPLVVGRSLGKTIRAKLLAFDKMKERNDELQKQVDELKEENGKLVTIGNGFALERNNLREELDELKKQFLSSCENCHLKKDIELLRYQKEQAEKNTAKEIYGWLKAHTFGGAGWELVKGYFREKGVEVE